MTYEEVIKALNEPVITFFEDEYDHREANNIAIECVKKQIPKKPRITIHNGFCPNCKNAFGKDYVIDAVKYPHWKRYCPVCSQAIDWSDNE